MYALDARALWWMGALVLWGCGGADRSTTTSEMEAALGQGAGSARGCFAGASDPTLHARDARRQADEAARSRVAAAVLGARIRSAAQETASTGGDERVSVTLEETRGVLRGIGVVGWWHDAKGEGPLGRCEGGCRPGTTWAVACLPGREGEAVDVLPTAFPAHLPGWLRPPHSTAGRLCAVGISGATLEPETAAEQAEEDARRRLAMRLCTRVDDARVQREVRAWRFTDQVACRPAVAHVEEHGEPEQRWVDAAGMGPLGEPGFTYVRVCIARPRAACGKEGLRASPPPRTSTRERATPRVGSMVGTACARPPLRNADCQRRLDAAHTLTARRTP